MNEEQVLEKLKKSVLGSDDCLLEMIVWRAVQFWKECPGDFCLQATGLSGFVFGGTNRVVWTISRGFRCDKSYCTQKFIEHFERVHNAA